MPPSNIWMRLIFFKESIVLGQLYDIKFSFHLVIGNGSHVKTSKIYFNEVNSMGFTRFRMFEPIPIYVFWSCPLQTHNFLPYSFIFPMFIMGTHVEKAYTIICRVIKSC